MAKLTNWGALISPWSSWGAFRRDGRSAHQVRALVRTSSKRRAAELLGMSLGHFNNFASETYNEAEVEALDCHPPETVLITGDQPGDTIGGQTGFIVRPG